MLPYRPAANPELVTWKAATEADEATTIARTIQRLRRVGYKFRDVAVLVRSSTSYVRLLEAFGEHNIPVQPAGRTGLFTERDAQAFGRTFAYLADHEWRSKQYGEWLPSNAQGSGPRIYKPVSAGCWPPKCGAQAAQ